ncbi:hypothetical protein ACFO0N_08085 [Halobium salinum]|uniref:Twin-arginine translocation signal domain-containing protein n=1 Tax=Halobium salinum TaxID=1364940 RepID=A0ABD5PAG5_9EURY|nr:hypothetical protein [Halobium salinum]
MHRLSRRDYLVAAGAAAAALPLAVGSTVGQAGPGGVPSAGDFLDFDRDENGDIRFDHPESGTRIRTRGDDFDFVSPTLRCDERPSVGRVRFTRFGFGGLPDPFDFKITEPRIRTRLDLAGERIDSDFDGVDNEFRVEGGDSTFEDDGDDDIDYVGRRFRFRQRGRRVEIDGDLRFDFDGIGDSDFRDFDEDVRSNSRRFRTQNRMLQVRYDRDSRDLEARRVV